MHNEFTCIIEKDEDWFILTALKFPAPTGRDEQKKNAVKTYRKLLH